MTLERIARVTITAKEAGRPLLQWLTNRFSYHDENAWRNLVTEGRLTINGKMTTCDVIVDTGDLVEYFPKHSDEPTVNRSYDVVYENDDLLILNKPPNLPCHPGGRFFHNTLWSKLKEEYKEVHLVNRLDRETSGLVTIAKNKTIAGDLGKLFADRKVAKEYLVVVEGLFPPSLEANGVLTDDVDSKVRKKRRFAKSGKGQACSTSFELIETRAGFSLVRAKPTTGRLHQIRATLASLNFPVVGDKIYGVDDSVFLRFITGSMTKRDASALHLNHQALHANHLSFELPGRDTLYFDAPIPKSTKSFLSAKGFVLI